MQVNQSSLAVDVVQSEIGDINKAALHVALTIGAFLVEDQVTLTLPYLKLCSRGGCEASQGQSGDVFKF